MEDNMDNSIKRNWRYWQNSHNNNINDVDNNHLNPNYNHQHHHRRRHHHNHHHNLIHPITSSKNFHHDHSRYKAASNIVSNLINDDELNTLPANIKISSIQTHLDSYQSTEAHQINHSNKFLDETNNISPPIKSNEFLDSNTNDIIRPTMKRRAMIKSNRGNKDETVSSEPNLHLVTNSSGDLFKRTISSDRLTLLAEPNQEQDQLKPTKELNHETGSQIESTTSIENNDIIYNNNNQNRETILSTNSYQIDPSGQQLNMINIKQTNYSKEDPSALETVSGHDFVSFDQTTKPSHLASRNQSASDINSTYIYSSLLIFLISTLFGYLLLRYLASSRRRAKFSSSFDDCLWPTISLLTPSKGKFNRSSRGHGRKKELDSRDTADIADDVNYDVKQLTSESLELRLHRRFEQSPTRRNNNSCEGTTLLDRQQRRQQQNDIKALPTSSLRLADNISMLAREKHDNVGENDDETIEVIQSELGHERDQYSCEFKNTTNVSPVSRAKRVAATIKRHLATNSLIVAATKGGGNCSRISKVIKLTTSAQAGGKFIDDEAKELRQQQDQPGTSTNKSIYNNFSAQMQSLLGDWLSSAKLFKNQVDGLNKEPLRRNCDSGQADKQIGTTDVVVVVTHHNDTKLDQDQKDGNHAKLVGDDNNSIIQQSDFSSSSSCSSAVVADQSSSSSNSNNDQKKNQINSRDDNSKKSSEKYQGMTSNALDCIPMEDAIESTEVKQASIKTVISEQQFSSNNATINAQAEEAMIHQSMFTNSNSPMSMFSPSPIVDPHLANNISSCRQCAVSSACDAGNQMLPNVSDSNGCNRAHHSACQLDHHNHLGASSPLNTTLASHDNNPLLATCRPCCSASPPDMMARQRQAQTNYNLFHQHQQESSPIRAPNHHHPLNDNHSMGRQASMPLVKRQHHYENYYDDEQEEAYRQLTASIGIQFGLNLNEAHLHHPLISSASAVSNGLADQNRSSCKCCAPSSLQPAYNCSYPATDSLVRTATNMVSNLCPDLECNICHHQTSNLTELNPSDHNHYRINVSQPSTTSILVQQPSTATPPPPPQATRYYHHQHHQSANTGRWEGSATDLRLPNNDNGDHQLASGHTSSGTGSDQEQLGSNGTSSNNNTNDNNNSTSATTSNLTDAGSGDRLNGSLESPNMMLMMQPKRHSVEPREMLQSVKVNDGADLGPPPVRAYASASPLLSTSPNFSQRLQQLQQQLHSTRLMSSNSSTRRRSSNQTLGSSYRVRKHFKLNEIKQNSISNGCSTSNSQQLQSPVQSRRRMSFGGDNPVTLRRMSTSSVQTPSTSSQLGASPSAKKQSFNNYTHHQHQSTTAAIQHSGQISAIQLRHRASIAADGSAAWWPMAESPASATSPQCHQQPLPFGRPRGGSSSGQQQVLDYYGKQARHLSAQYYHYQHQQRRPSDCSLPLDHHGGDNLQCCYGGGSSSAGSSSGIGFSGSQCTNTPTASSFPYASFGVMGPANNLANENNSLSKESAMVTNTCLDLQPHQSADQQQYQQPGRLIQSEFQMTTTSDNKQQPQFVNNGNHLHTGAICQKSIVQLQQHQQTRNYQAMYHPSAGHCCSNRKFSLPVQLESRQIALASHENQQQQPTTTAQPTNGSPRPKCKRSALLFEENLIRADSSNNLPAAINQSVPTNEPSILDSSQRWQPQQLPATASTCDAWATPSDIALPGDSFRWWPNGQRASRSSAGFGQEARRRSSQTITRQSSFWLDDNGTPNSATTNTMADSAIMSSNWSAACTSGRQSFCDDTASQLDLDLVADELMSPAVISNPSVNYGRMSPTTLEGQDVEAESSNLMISQSNNYTSQQVSDTTHLANTSNNIQQQGAQSQQSDNSSIDWPTVPKLSNNHPPSPSSSSPASMSSPKDKTRPGGCPFKAMAAAAASGGTTNTTSRANARYRLSSSSTTSSAGSSPSPDCGMRPPSERILALGSKSKQSSSITKRHLYARLRMRTNGSRYSRIAAGTSENGLATSKSSCDGQHQRQPRDNNIEHDQEGDPLSGRKPDDESNSSCTSVDATIGDNVAASTTSSTNNGQPAQPIRPSADPNSSASLERQCRDLWKLRATLHHDSCVANDDWSNYHQRLNRRYDSGYKSIENQFSSSIEGANATAVSVAEGDVFGDQLDTPTPNSVSAPQPHQQLDTASPRPPSGCSGFINPPRTIGEQESSFEDCNQLLDLNPTKQVSNLLDESPRFSNLNLSAGDPAENNNQFTAGARVEFIDTDPRDCHSRSSKSSNETAES